MNKHPLIIFTVLFICGIVFRNYIEIELLPAIYLWAFLLAVTFIYYFKKRNSSLIQLLFFIHIFIIGYLFSSLFSPDVTKYPFEKQRYKNAKVIGEISNIELPRNGRIVFEIQTDSIITSDFSQQRNIKLLCNVFEDSKNKLKKVYDKLSIGNKILIEANLHKGKEERNPGEFDYQKYLESKEISALLYCYKLENLVIINNEDEFLLNIVFNIRKIIDEQIQKYSNSNSAALLRGLLLADRSEVDYETRESFVNAGVIHVLAVSGLHVGFIILIFLFLFNRLNIVLRYVLTIIGLLIFLVITGSQPSVLRATIMSVVLILSFLANRSYNSINAISLAAFIILIINPQEIFNPGFQLSFSAVLSILILYPVFQKKIKKYRIRNKLINSLLLFAAVSMAAQIGTVPFTLYYFKKLSIIALFANLIVIPVIGFIVGIGIFTLFISLLWNWLAIIYSSANDFLIELLFRFVDLTGNLKLSYLSITDFSKYDSIIFYSAILFIFIFYKRFDSYKTKFLFLFLITINFSLLISFDNKSILTENKLVIIAIDVGQGDGIFIKFPNGETALIDAGNRTPNFDTGERIIKPFFENMEIEKIDYGFVSHMDADHYGGYFSLFDNGYLKTIYKSTLDTTLKKDINFEKYTELSDIKVKHYKKEILKIGNCRVYILNDTNAPLYKSLTINDKSGILKIIFGNTSFLFTGDAGVKTENILLNEFDSFLDSDILKLGHHGSKTSSSEKFLDAVSPEYAVISAGVENKFKHPSKEVVERLIRKNIKMKRTDLQGAVIIESDGYKIDFIDWKKN